MPLVQISIVAGRDTAMKRRLVENVTDAVVDALAVRAEQVRVLLYELPPAHWAVAGQTKEDERERAS